MEEYIVNILPNKLVTKKTKHEYDYDFLDITSDFKTIYDYIILNKISLRQKVKIICEICNSYVSKNHIARHFKTQKHINNMNNLIK